MVRLEGVTSERRKVVCGVAKGTVLGPIVV